MPESPIDSTLAAIGENGGRARISRRQALGLMAAVGLVKIKGTPDADPVLKRVTQGLPTTSAVRFTTWTSNVTKVRIRLETLSGVVLRRSTAVTPDGDGYSQLAITALPPNTELRYQVEGQQLGGPWNSLGQLRPARTAPPEGASFRWLAWACTHHDEVEGDRAPYDLAMSRSPAFGLLCGDQNYRDITSTDPADHRQAWENAWAETPGMYDLMANVPHGVEVSDHDSGEGSNRGAGSEAIPAQIDAFFQMLPQTDRHPGGTRAFAFSWSSFSFICPDFRNTHRTDPRDSGPQTAYGATQMGWISDRISEAKAAGHFIFYISDAVWLGTTLGSKKDCLASYPDDRQQISDWLLSYPHMIVNFDFHHLTLNQNGTQNPSGGPVVGAAGMIANSGNLVGDGYYNWYHPPVLPRVPVREFVDFDCADQADRWIITAHFFDTKVDGSQEINTATWERLKPRPAAG